MYLTWYPSNFQILGIQWLTYWTLRCTLRLLSIKGSQGITYELVTDHSNFACDWQKIFVINLS